MKKGIAFAAFAIVGSCLIGCQPSNPDVVVTPGTNTVVHDKVPVPGPSSTTIVHDNPPANNTTIVNPPAQPDTPTPGTSTSTSTTKTTTSDTGN